MSGERDVGSMEDMLAHAHRALRIAQGKTRADLDRDELLDLALQRLVEIIGEAAARVSPGARAQHPLVPWADIVGMRNRLIHGYDVVDPDLLWDAVVRDIPALVAQLEHILEEAEGTG